MQTVPGWASDSSRAAIFTPSPKISSPSTITSPRLTPIRSSRRRSGGSGSLIARGPLHFDGAVQRIDDARKIRQQAVTGRADDPSAVRSDQRVDGAAQFTQGLVGTRLVFAHQPAETGYIRVQNCGELPLPRSSFFRRTRRVIEQGSHRGCV